MLSRIAGSTTLLRGAPPARLATERSSGGPTWRAVPALNPSAPPSLSSRSKSLDPRRKTRGSIRGERSLHAYLRRAPESRREATLLHERCQPEWPGPSGCPRQTGPLCATPSGRCAGCQYRTPLPDQSSSIASAARRSVRFNRRKSMRAVLMSRSAPLSGRLQGDRRWVISPADERQRFR
jgi:hypothetical protein